MPYISEQEHQQYQELLKSRRDEEESNHVDLSAYNLTTFSGTVAARHAIEELPAGVQESWLRRLAEATEEAIEESQAEPVPSALDDAATAEFHRQLDAATTEDETRAVLSAHGQLDE